MKWSHRNAEPPHWTEKKKYKYTRQKISLRILHSNVKRTGLQFIRAYISLSLFNQWRFNKKVLILRWQKKKKINNPTKGRKRQTQYWRKKKANGFHTVQKKNTFIAYFRDNRISLRYWNLEGKFIQFIPQTYCNSKRIQP